MVKTSQLQTMSFTQYSEVKSTAKLVLPSDPKTAMVKKVGANISSAVNRYLSNNGCKDLLKEF
tara:strand:+ start:752 stop:940 length:189 start_codon:yes stop_codon:yes gene_type:complete